MTSTPWTPELAAELDALNAVHYRSLKKDQRERRKQLREQWDAEVAQQNAIEMGEQALGRPLARVAPMVDTSARGVNAAARKQAAQPGYAEQQKQITEDFCVTKPPAARFEEPRSVEAEITASEETVRQAAAELGTTMARCYQPEAHNGGTVGQRMTCADSGHHTKPRISRKRVTDSPAPRPDGAATHADASVLGGMLDGKRVKPGTRFTHRHWFNDLGATQHAGCVITHVQGDRVGWTFLTKGTLAAKPSEMTARETLRLSDLPVHEFV
jgi:hypothetical protein